MVFFAEVCVIGVKHIMFTKTYVGDFVGPFVLWFKRNEPRKKFRSIFRLGLFWLQ